MDQRSGADDEINVLKELILLERFYDTLSDDLRVWLIDKKPKLLRKQANWTINLRFCINLLACKGRLVIIVMPSQLKSAYQKINQKRILIKIRNRLKMEQCRITDMYQRSNQVQKLSATHVTKWIIKAINVF